MSTGMCYLISPLVKVNLNDLYGILYAMAIAESGDVERARVELERGKAGIAAFGLEALKSYAAYGSGLISEQEGDCRSAVESYRQAVSLSPAELSFGAALGRCQRELGQCLRKPRDRIQLP